MHQYKSKREGLLFWFSACCITIIPFLWVFWKRFWTIYTLELDERGIRTNARGAEPGQWITWEQVLSINFNPNAAQGVHREVLFVHYLPRQGAPDHEKRYFFLSSLHFGKELRQIYPQMKRYWKPNE